MIRFEKMNEKVKVALEKYNNSAKSVSDFEEVQAVFKEYAGNVFEIEKELGATALTGMDGKFFCENLFTAGNNIVEDIYNLILNVQQFIKEENKKDYNVTAEVITYNDKDCTIPATLNSQGIYFYSMFLKGYVNDNMTTKVLAIDFFISEDNTITYDVRPFNADCEYQTAAETFEEDFNSRVENGEIDSNNKEAIYEIEAKDIYNSKNMCDMDFLRKNIIVFVGVINLFVSVS